MGKIEKPSNSEHINLCIGVCALVRVLKATNYFFLSVNLA